MVHRRIMAPPILFIPPSSVVWGLGLAEPAGGLPNREVLIVVVV